MSLRIGLDLGGTKIEGVALADDGAIVLRNRVRTPRSGAEDVVEAIVGLVASIEREVGECRRPIGIGTPGTISPFTGLMKNSNTTALNGLPLDRMLEAGLGRPVLMRNDADCFALSEARAGAGVGSRTVFGVIIGTGVGGGIVIDGRLVTGPSAIAGEWGHVQLPWQTAEEWPGHVCYCGRSGCVETYLSGPALARDHHLVTGEDRSAEEIVTAARRRDPAARASLDRYVDRLARGLAMIIDILDPDAIVLGGGMSNVDELYAEVPKAWVPHVFGDRVATRLLPNLNGDSSGVLGAAWLVPLD